jgi:poly(3-hydroxybutyrate) depolymerase
MKRLAPGLTVIVLCQGGVPALAATALLARDHDPHTPAALILIAAPIDPLANPTRVVKLLRSRPVSWFEANVIRAVPQKYAGAGRPVYPAHLHLIPLWAYLTRCVTEGSEIAAKVLFDDGADPAQFPFLDLYTSIMDLDAKFFLENTRIVFQDCLLRERALRFQGEPVNLSAIKQTALLTIEGKLDDIAAPGQTGAAHAFCTSLPHRLRHRIIVPGSGHFSLFYGDTWRREVLPVIRSFCVQNAWQGRKVSLEPDSKATSARVF